MRGMGAFRVLAVTSALMLGASGATYAAEEEGSEKTESPAVEATPPAAGAEEAAEQPAEAPEGAAEEADPGAAQEEGSEPEQQ